MPFNPTPEQKREVFRNSAWYEILHTFCVPMGMDQTDCFQWESVNFSRMSHARLLANFYETRFEDRRDDDVLAADYGFVPRPVLDKEDRKRLNKDLLHLSYARLRHTPATKPWPNSILASLLAPTLEFMRLVEDRIELFHDQYDQWNWKRLRMSLESGQELQVRIVSYGEVCHNRFKLGRLLPEGKPALTEFFHSSQPPVGSEPIILAANTTVQSWRVDLSSSTQLPQDSVEVRNDTEKQARG